MRHVASGSSGADLRGGDTVPTTYATMRRQRASPRGRLRPARTAPGDHALPAHRKAGTAHRVTARHEAPALPAGYGRITDAPVGPTARTVGPSGAEPLYGEPAKLLPPGFGGMPPTGTAGGSGTPVGPVHPPTRSPEVLGTGAPV